MEPEGSLPYSQAPATCPCPERAPSNPHNPFPLPQDPSVFMCFVFIWEQTATCTTYIINGLVFITEMKSVYCAVRTGSLNKAVCASYLKGSYWPLPCTSLQSPFIWTTKPRDETQSLETGLQYVSVLNCLWCQTQLNTTQQTTGPSKLELRLTHTLAVLILSSLSKIEILAPCL